ncbi:YuiB family protein [Brevibacillus fluminis]|uniref:YuiB family protein n=1 Tax=Brevibacillus fluminis TaxID=511487 RepID=UPI003F89FB7D
MNIIQFLISIVLFTILAFGIGFILNMVLRTTWLPVIVCVGVVVGALVLKNIVPTGYDLTILLFGMAGSVMSGYTIQLLRKKGYRMF